MTNEQQLKELTEKIKASGNPKALRALEIVEHVTESAEITVNNLQKLSAYSRKVPRIVRKKPFSKKEQKRLQFLLYHSAIMNAIMLRAKLFQPIPRYPKGAS